MIDDETRWLRLVARLRVKDPAYLAALAEGIVAVLGVIREVSSSSIHSIDEIPSRIVLLSGMGPDDVLLSPVQCALLATTDHRERRALIEEIHQRSVARIEECQRALDSIDAELRARKGRR